MFKKWKKEELDKYNPKKNNKNPKKGKNPEKRKIMRKLKHKMKYLEIEYEEVEELLNKSKLEFFNAIRDFCTKNPSATCPLQPVASTEEKIKEIENLDEVKTIYREIVKATHPDKHPGEEEGVKEIFINASQAKDENKIEDLINISFGLNIDISNISIDLIEEIEQSLEDKQNKINQMRKDTSILWYTSTDDVKDKLIKQICPIPK